MKISKTVSRVMSRIIIYLGLLLPAASSDLPESRPGKPVALCLVLLRMGFTCAPSVTRRAVVSYTAFPPLPGFPRREKPFPPKAGRYISIALALESPPPDVIRHPALRSPDFPHLPYSRKKRSAAIIHFTYFLRVQRITFQANARHTLNGNTI